MKLAVLIVTYRRPELLANCLAALARQVRMPDEVLVIGASGDDPTYLVWQEWAAHIPFPCKWYAAPAPGVVLQTNLGLANCQTDLVAFLDDDAEPFPDWVVRIRARYLDDAVGGVGGRDIVHLPDGGIVNGASTRVGQITWFGRRYGNHHLRHAQLSRVDVLKGVNMSCRRGLISQIDERVIGKWGRHWEMDVCFQIQRAGKALLYDPSICVDHFRFAAPRSDAERAYYFYTANHNLVLMLLKNLSLGRRLAFLLYTFAWGDYPEMGVAVFSRTYLHRVLNERNLGFIRVLRPCFRGKVDALRSLMRVSAP